MPNSKIMQFMQQGAPPTLSQQRTQRELGNMDTASRIKQNMTSMQMNEMQMDRERQTMDFLHSQENIDMTDPKFANDMMRVNPQMALKIQENIARMQPDQVKAAAAKMEQIAKIAISLNTKEKWDAYWQQQGKPIPWEQREQIIMTHSSLQQALGRNNEMWRRENPLPQQPQQPVRANYIQQLARWVTTWEESGGDPNDYTYRQKRAELDEAQRTGEFDKLERKMMRGGQPSPAPGTAQPGALPSKPATSPNIEQHRKTYQ